jgi:hypothetical protein
MVHSETVSLRVSPLIVAPYPERIELGYVRLVHLEVVTGGCRDAGLWGVCVVYCVGRCVCVLCWC